MKTLIYDLETSSTDVNKAVPRIMGFISSENPVFQWTADINEMVALIHAHDVIIGYNNDDYDNVIMKKSGAHFYGKIIIDIMKIVHGKGFGNDLGRKSIIKLPEGYMNTLLQSKSLDALSKVLKGPEKIGDFDYDLFKKQFHKLNDDQQKIAIEYLERDIEITKYCFDFLNDYFKNLFSMELNGKQLLNKEQWGKMYYLTSSTASLTYKIICNLTGLEERYDNTPKEDYGGGFVALPDRESAKGKIYCLDYNSLYPHIMIQANLYGRITGADYDFSNHWVGEGICETSGVYSRTQHPVGIVLQNMFQERMKLKKAGDSREYTLKIILNTIYGLLGNPSFASVCDFKAAADCTRLGQQWVKAARLHFKEHGYDVLYTDTDSVYLLDPFNNKTRLLQVKDEHINDIKSRVPFPVDTFDMGIDDEIKYIAFFKHGDVFKKKHYLYVTNDNKIVLKGIALVKSDATPLGKKIFNTYIKPCIINESKHKFQKSVITQWIEEELNADLSLAGRQFKIKNVDFYSVEHSIHAQIAKSHLYGPGNHIMFKLRGAHEKGVGKQANYVSTKYADEIRITQLDLSKTWSELDNFIEETQHTLEGFIE